jgi:hypothetical protein
LYDIRDPSLRLVEGVSETISETLDRCAERDRRAHCERDSVRLDARSTSVAAGGRHWRMLAVLPDSLSRAARPDRLHAGSVDELRRERHGARSTGRLRERGEDAEVGVKLHALDPAYAERLQTGLIFEASESTTTAPRPR